MSPFVIRRGALLVHQMSDKEILRSQVLEQVMQGRLKQSEAALRLGVSVRQVKRLKQRYAADGVTGLISQRRGRPSNRRICPEVIAQAMQLIGRHYADFGPTLACEKLEEQHGIHLSVETIRQQMVAAGYWKPKRGRQCVAHPLRDRRPRRGELIQIDGSPHDWFEGRAAYCCLLVFIDDATSELMDLQFVKAETTLDYMAALARYIHRHGVPIALYSDRHNIFRINLPNVSNDAQTQFSRALGQLHIEGIQAHSPQAKGRVERANQTLQDRLTKEMRLQGLNDWESANAWLPGFMADYNRRFAVEPACEEDAHLPYQGHADELQRILSVQEDRRLSKNLSCQYGNQLLQVRTVGEGLSLRGAKVRIHAHWDGRTEMCWQGRTLRFDFRSKPVKQQAPVDAKSLNEHVDFVIAKYGKPHSDKHPWKKAFKPQKTESAVTAQFHASQPYCMDADSVTG